MKIAACLAVGIWAVFPLYAADDFHGLVKPFVETFCVECHGPEKQKAKRRFDHLPEVIGNDEDLLEYQDIIDQLNLDEMPPTKSLQPSVVQQRRVTAWLTAQVSAYHDSRKGKAARTVLRRMNAREYRNTTRDLLSLNTTVFDPARFFPKDQTTDHLDNVGETLVTSGHLLARYLEAADLVVTKALGSSKRPETQTWIFKENFKQQPEVDQVHGKSNKYKHMTLYEVIGADKHEGAYGAIHDFRQGVPHDGWYEITVKAEALNRQHPYDRDLVPTDPDEKLRLGIRPGNQAVGDLAHTQPVEPLLAEVILEDGEGTYTMKVWLDAGWTPRFTFPNGTMDIRDAYSKVLKRHKDLFPKARRKGIVENRWLVLHSGAMPQIRLHEIKIKGPLYPEWPTASQRALLGADWQRGVDGALTKTELRTHAEVFASRAFRRPAPRESVDRMMEVIDTQISAGKSQVEAFGDGVKVALCSPFFLYHESGGTVLSPYALASRLSYFLWSAPPDERLLELARSGAITRPEVLRDQVRRLLKDDRSDAFIDGFLDSWLTFRDLGSAPPDRSAFRGYYQYNLQEAMQIETRMFVRHLIAENRDISEFLDCSYAFINRGLARLYELPLPEGPGFHKVALTDRRRGGLLGQGSVLTVTANGIDTSPVVRGVWLLENILGAPPAPPPDDVAPLDPDIRGAKTIRDQLDMHRENPACYDCHQAIDPLGFALENFDPVGRWRTSYGRNTKIDASGELPNGEKFADVRELKDVLLARKGRFARALTTKLLAYSLGRHVSPTDRPHIDDILMEHERVGNGFGDLIKLVVLSEPFKR